MKKDIAKPAIVFSLVLATLVGSSLLYSKIVLADQLALLEKKSYAQSEVIAEQRMQQLLLQKNIEQQGQNLATIDTLILAPAPMVAGVSKTKTVTATNNQDSRTIVALVSENKQSSIKKTIPTSQAKAGIKTTTKTVEKTPDNSSALAAQIAAARKTAAVAATKKLAVQKAMAKKTAAAATAKKIAVEKAAAKKMANQQAAQLTSAAKQSRISRAS